MAMAVALALAAVGAQAMTVSYQCTGRRLLTAELTPRIGQIHFEGQNWTLARVRSGRDARYVNAKEGVDVVTKERAMTFTHGTETLQCFLFSDALPGDAPKKSN
jgi:membrane-bound inhibitor of C-type lysozyme